MKAVFLDRDGVINRYPGDTKYVTRWREFHFLPWAKHAIARLCRHKFKVFIISNQAGVGKGIFSRKTLDAITAKMLKGLSKAGGKITQIYYCTHRKEDHCACRKPKIGAIISIKKKYPGIKLRDSFFVGDTIRDIATAKKCGCQAILVLSGKEKLTQRKDWQERPDFIFSGLWQAVQFILRQQQL